MSVKLVITIRNGKGAKIAICRTQRYIFRVKYITVKKNQDIVKKIEKTRSADVTPDLQAERLERDRRVIEEDKKVARKKADEEHKLKLVNSLKISRHEHRSHFRLPKKLQQK